MLRGIAIDAHPTGSLYICNPPPQGSDEDWVILSGSNVLFIRHSLQEAGFRYDDNYNFIDSYRKNNLNLLVARSRIYYETFIEATELAKARNILGRNERVKLFCSVLDDSRKTTIHWKFRTVLDYMSKVRYSIESILRHR